MNNSYQMIYDWIKANMWKDGLSTTAEAIKKNTGVSLGTVYGAVKYFKDNGLIRVENHAGNLLFLNDITNCEFIQTENKRFYILHVRVIADNIKWIEKTNMKKSEIDLLEEGV